MNYTLTESQADEMVAMKNLMCVASILVGTGMNGEGREMATEYWCDCGGHWVDEVRALEYGELPSCKACCLGDWDGHLAIVREVKELRYKAQLGNSGDWHIWDGTEWEIVDYTLTERQAKELVALRNKWESE